MKKNVSIPIAFCGIVLVALGWLPTLKSSINPELQKEIAKESKEEGQEIAGALATYKSWWQNPNTGELDIAAILDSRTSLDKFHEDDKKKTRAFPTLSFEERGPNNVGGRLRSLLIDKNNHLKIMAGSASGGLWVSTDGANNWKKHPQTDTFSSLAIMSMEQGLNGAIYLGTGEKSNLTGNLAVNAGGTTFPGAGMWKSTDGGNTFKFLTTTKPVVNTTGGDDWGVISKIQCSPTDSNIVWATTNRGLWKSVNGGAAWTKVGTPVGNADCWDLEILPNNNIYLGTSTGIFMSTDAGTTFTTKVNNSGLPPSSVVSRVEIAPAPSNVNVLYAIYIDQTPGRLYNIYKTSDGGANWSVFQAGGGATFEPFGTNGGTTFQGGWGVCLEVNPTNEDELYLGGMQTLYRYTPAEKWKLVAYWQGSVAFGQNIHSDMHDIIYDKTDPSKLYVATDGGVYKTGNASAIDPLFAFKSKNLNATQAFSSAANRYNVLATGNQDNGTQYFGTDKNSPMDAVEILGGDGGTVWMSDIFDNVIFGCVTYSGEWRRSISPNPGFTSFANSLDKNIDAGGEGVVDDDGTNALWNRGVASLEVPNADPAKVVSNMVITTNAGVWMTQTAGDPGSLPVWFKIGTLNGASAVCISQDGKAVFAGSQTGQIIRISGLNLLKPKYYEYLPFTTGPNKGKDSTWNKDSVVQKIINTVPGNRFVTSLRVDDSKTGSNTLVATLANFGSTLTNFVLKSTDCRDSLTPTFTNITANLPKMPVYDAAFLPGSKTSIIIGTQSGLFGTDNGGTSWTELNTAAPNPAQWHPRVVTTDVFFKTNIFGYNGPVLYTGTHGRGMFCSYTLATKWPTKIATVNDVNNKLDIAPNPMVNDAVINIESTTFSKATIVVYSLTGTLVKRIEAQLNSGSNKVALNFSDLKSGAYIVSAIVNGKAATRTVIKQ